MGDAEDAKRVQLDWMLAGDEGVKGLRMFRVRFRDASPRTATSKLSDSPLLGPLGVAQRELKMSLARKKQLFEWLSIICTSLH